MILTENNEYWENFGGKSSGSGFLFFYNKHLLMILFLYYLLAYLSFLIFHDFILYKSYISRNSLIYSGLFNLLLYNSLLQIFDPLSVLPAATSALTISSFVSPSSFLISPAKSFINFPYLVKKTTLCFVLVFLIPSLFQFWFLLYLYSFLSFY